MELFTLMQSLLLVCLCISGDGAGSFRANARGAVTTNSRAMMRILRRAAMPVARLTSAPVPAVLRGDGRHDLKRTMSTGTKRTMVTGEVETANATHEEGVSLPMMSFVDEPVPQITEEPSAPKGFAGLFDGMRFTVVRIQAIVAKVDWLQPYKAPSDSPFIGSGFVVQSGDDDPVFLTNAHVVQDARIVQVQLPAIGQMIFDAYVPLICKRFDLAVVQLKEPKKFWEALKKHNGTMHALPVRPSTVNLGLEVAAVGFPLGSSSLKLSRGIISGTEMVDGTICYQSTAPISPGSSGGPLFAVGSESGVPAKAEDLQIIGVNFASSVSEGAQNVNYVVPTVHIQQVLHEFQHLKATLFAEAKATATGSHLPTQVDTANSSASDAPPATVGSASSSEASPATLSRRLRLHSPARRKLKQDVGQHHPLTSDDLLHMQAKSEKAYPHFQLRIAPIDAIGIEASEALYDNSGGCHQGVFLSRILPTSALHSAEPPVHERSFLTVVDNVTLDSFGMGRTENFLGDPTPFESLMTLRERIDDPVSLTTCQHGKETKHVVSIRWRPQYSVAVEDVEEPHFESKYMDFDVFAGVTFMQMTVNHIVELLKAGRPQTLSRWLLIENQEVPRLVITHVEEGTYASRVLTSGMVVQQVNGQNVSTLSDLRQKFHPKGMAWTLETDRGLIFTVGYKDSLTEQVTSAVSSPGRRYLLSPAPLAAAKGMKLVSSRLLELSAEYGAQLSAEDGLMALKAQTYANAAAGGSDSIPRSFLATAAGPAANIV